MSPFTIGFIFVYSVTIVQASVIKNQWEWLDRPWFHASIHSFVVIFGYLIGNILYPVLAKHSCRLTTTYRSAIGNIPASFFYGWLWLVDRRITYAYENDGSQISILYQIPCYAAIIAAGWSLCNGGFFRDSICRGQKKRRGLLLDWIYLWLLVLQILFVLQ